MHSLASAARVLERCDSVPATTPLLEALGFDAPILLSRDHTERLGLAGSPAIHLARGGGALRAIVFEDEGADLRASVNAFAHAVAKNGPHMLWMIICISRNRGDIAIAAVDSSLKRTRVTALVTRRDAVVDSDSETFCALEAARNDSDVLTHCRWLEILGRESVGRRFFRAFESGVSHLAKSLDPRVANSDASDLALLYASRLLFLSFLETKGWLDRDHGFLANRYADCMIAGGGYHRRVLAPLFFGTLNTKPGNRAATARAFGRIPFLNGGLFAKSALETRTSAARFSDEALGDFFGDLLTRYRFTAREDATTWSEAAIDPEMLGKAFECLMSTRERKESGTFYTPQALVAQVVAAALSHRLATHAIPAPVIADALAGDTPKPETSARMLRALQSLTVLDPACGSGAFLVQVLEEVSRLRAQLGDAGTPHRIRRSVLTASIFGVDINPTAVWLCELRLWLSMAIEDPESDPLRVMPLPNLDRNIRVGNSLSGDDFSERAHRVGSRSVATLRGRYARATGPRKRSLSRALDAAERRHAMRAAAGRIVTMRWERRELLAAQRSRDLFGCRLRPDPEIKTRLSELRSHLKETSAEQRRLQNGGALPFSFISGFADVAAAGGFDVVVGNPPWVRTHNLTRHDRTTLRARFEVFRNSAWRYGSEVAGAGRGFSSQVDAAALFTERSVKLLRDNGVASLLLPSKLWRSLAGGGVRELLLSTTEVQEIHDLSSASTVFDAAVYPSILIARRRSRSEQVEATSAMTIVVHRGGKAEAWQTPPRRIGFDESPGSPWILLPPPVREAFDRVSRAGIPLHRTTMGRPLLGVKTGFNDSFLVTELLDRGDGMTSIRNAHHESFIENEILRPVVRGENVERWRVPPDDSRVIWTHDAHGSPLSTLPPATLCWLSRWRRELESRTDARGKYRWWSLFRVESADTSLPRVIWSDIGRVPRAAVLPAGDNSVPLNTCYAIRCPSIDDAYALAAVINSDLAAAWLGVIAEPARGGYRRFMGWTMALLPMPHDWTRAKRLVAPIARNAARGAPHADSVLHSAVLDAYGLTAAEVASLVAWSA